MVQDAAGLWHLQSVEITEKASGKVYYFPCPPWLNTDSSIRVKMYLGHKPAKPVQISSNCPAPVPEEEEDWQALVALPKQTAEDNGIIDDGVTGNYMVRYLQPFDTVVMWC